MLHDFITAFDISLSDGFLIYCLLPSAAFFLTYVAASPWWRVKKYGWLGVVTVLHSFSTLLLLLLIVYGIVFGQKLDESYRVFVAFVLAASLTFKYIVFLIERRKGRILRRDARRARKVQEPAA